MYRFQLCCLSCVLFLLFNSTSAQSPSGDNATQNDNSTINDQILGFDKAELDLLISNQPLRPDQADETLSIEQLARSVKSESRQSQTSPIGMPTGNAKSIYYQMGLDIAKLAASNGLKINAKPSSGSLDNLRRMVSNENAGLAIVRSDVIEFLSNNPSSINQSIIDNLRSVFSLYSEEIHLLARKNIKTLSDLNNKRVIVGELGSGTPVTANMVFDKIGIDIEAVTGIAPEDAFKQFILGKADAIFFVGGKPISYIHGLLEMKNDDKLSKYVDDIHLLPIDDERLYDTFSKATIAPADYQSNNRLHRLTETIVPTVTTQALLVSYDFAQNDSAYYRLRCKQIGQLNTVMRKSLEKIASDKTGKYHPKWAQVNFDEIVNLPKNQCISDESIDPATIDSKAIDCYLKTGRSCG